MKILRKYGAAENSLTVTTARGTAVVHRDQCTAEQWNAAVQQVTEALFAHWRSKA